MEPLYSILLCNKSLSEYEPKIKEWLHSGIKVLWFGKHEDAVSLKNAYIDFADAYLLQVYDISISAEGLIIDGNGDDELFNMIAKECSSFNSAQYSVEHCDYDENIEVQASAGTGKTTVMIDRIMFLLHTRPNLKLENIFMITFTRAAAKEMNRRLQDALMTRYRLTGQKKYFRWVEEQSQMHISTIHSFAYYLMKQLGINEGFSRNLSIRKFEYKKNELVKDTIDDKLNDVQKIQEQLGVPLYRSNSLVRQYWDKFSRLGISHRDILEMDWGEPSDENSENFFRILKETVPELDEKYFELKRKLDAIDIDDIMRDFQEILLKGNLPETDITIDYLFIDEFQDTDLSQINVACMLAREFDARLFVVGDVKQSIYRFRGANEKAFEVFNNELVESGLRKTKVFTLVNNYRTATNVLKRMDSYFSAWGKDGLLDYSKSVIPNKPQDGTMKIIMARDKETPPDQICEIVRAELEKLEKKIEKKDGKVNEKDRVVVLVRTNKELDGLSGIFKNAKIPATVRQEGKFYVSEAVRDFYAMVSSFLFCDEPKYIFNYLITPYAGEIDPMDIGTMEMLNGDVDNLTEYLDHFLNQTTWKKYHKELRLKPVLSVFKDMLDNESIIDNYISLNKYRKLKAGWKDSDAMVDTLTNARQYEANLEKLMEVLQDNLSGEKISLYDVYKFLNINISTNREVTDEKVESRDDYKSVLCMTVHGSKGLEFNTVIMPYTDEIFNAWENTDLYIESENKYVGWFYDGDKKKVKQKNKSPQMSSSYYGKLLAAENISSNKEGARLLYVGMTRAIDTLICIVEPKPTKYTTWAKLLMNVGVDYE